MTEIPKPVPESMAEIRQLLLEQIANRVPAAEGSRSEPAESGEPNGTADPARSSLGPAAGEDDSAAPLDPRTKAIMSAKLQMAVDQYLAPDFIEGGRALFEKRAKVGYDAAGNIVVSIGGGAKEPLTPEAVEQAVGPQFVRALGKPGTGLRDVGNAAPSEDIVALGLADQAYFEKHQEQILTEIQRRNRR